MHISRGLPLISAEHDPHFPALQFQRHGQVRRLLRLDLVHRVEHDHALRDLGGVVLEARRRRRARFARFGTSPALTVSAPR